MTVPGRRLPFAGIGKAFDCVTATKGWSRPEAVIQVSCRERPLLDRKADIAYEEIIVRCGIQRDRPFFYLVADVGQADSLGRLIANSRQTHLADLGRFLRL